MNVQHNKLIERIGTTVINSVPVENWVIIKAHYVSVANWARLGIFYFIDNSLNGISFIAGDDLPYQDRPFSLFKQLKQEISKVQQEKGTWFTATMEIEKNGKFKINFEYDTKPDIAFEILDETFLEEFRKYPRDPQYIPEWLHEILVRHGRL